MANEMHLDDPLGFELFELVPDAIIVVDRRGTIRYANRSAGELFGREARTLVSTPVEALLPEELRHRHIEHRATYGLDPHKRPMGTGLDLVALRADGTPVPVDIMLNPLKHLAEPMVLAVVRDVTERKRAEARMQLLMREINHRAKNILSVVQAMAHQTEASSCEEFIARFDERIQSLSASHDLLVRSEWRNVPLAELVRSQLAHFRALLDGRIIVRGPDLRITATAAQAIGMANHELATNASKYGALSNDRGRVDIAWCVERSEAGSDRFTIEWSESGGPTVVPPKRRGFGWSVLCELTKMSLGADVTLDYAPTGLVWRLGCSADRVRET
ncbi:MAG TPA: HWE histidine kinase domain-containing protein [Xanthobacteraceae bacterium]|nr:HWE histidine kinase domain-containing protein [Xanthobacteraceae bacterium]